MNLNWKLNWMTRVNNEKMIDENYKQFKLLCGININIIIEWFIPDNSRFN